MFLIVLGILLALPFFAIRSLPVAPFLLVPAIIIGLVGSFLNIGFGAEKTNLKNLVICLAIALVLFCIGIAVNSTDVTLLDLFT